MMENPHDRPPSDRFAGRDDRKAADKQQNIQDAFLNSARRDKTLITIYMVGGMKLTGRIRSFDKYSLILDSNSQEQLVFKHAIATVVLPRAGSGTGTAPPEG